MRRSIKYNSVFNCPSCRSSNYQVYCPAGMWEVCSKDDEGAIVFNTYCNHCNYEGIVYMRGMPFPTFSDAASAYHEFNL